MACSEKTTARSIIRLSGGGFVEHGAMHSLYWDEHGAYLGQEQESATDSDTLVFRARGNEAGMHGLSYDEMDAAKGASGNLPEWAA